MDKILLSEMGSASKEILRNMKDLLAIE